MCPIKEKASKHAYVHIDLYVMVSFPFRQHSQLDDYALDTTMRNLFGHLALVIFLFMNFRGGAYTQWWTIAHIFLAWSGGSFSRPKWRKIDHDGECPKALPGALSAAFALFFHGSDAAQR